jgi:magnesium transporter
MPDRMATGQQITIVCRSGDGGVVRTDDPAVVKEALADENALVWVDFTIQTDEDAWILRDIFAFHELTIEDCVSPRIDPAKIDDYGSYLFIIVQAVTEYRFGEEMEPVEVDFYLGHNYVVSCRREPVPAIDQYRERCRRDESLLLQPPDRLLHGLLDAIVDEYLPIVDKVDDDIDNLEGLVIRKPQTSQLQGILTVKRNALRLRRATIPQREIMNRLSRNEFPQLIRPEMAMYFRDVYDHLVRIEYLVEALRDLADGALNTYLSVVSNRLNEVMKVLTAATVIFLPGAVIAGIYGTNFPEDSVWPPYSSDWGFAAMVAVIVAIIVVMLVYFRRRGWV